MIEKDKIRLQELSHKWLKGTLTELEQAEFDKWFNQSDDAAVKIPEDLALSKFEHKQLMLTRIRELAGIPERRKTVSLWPRIAVAAAVAVVIFGAGLFYFAKNNGNQNQDAAYAGDIAPGKMGATLTLANGKTIKLANASNGELAQESGLTISKTADGQVIYSTASADGSSENKINTLSTAKGETYILTLSDKTQVWLNAASSLTYSAALNERGQRRVKLSGEAYFQVAKDKLHPFIVETDKQEVEVLGTHFNVSAYPDDQAVKTTLLEGSVKVAANGRSERLVPNQQSILSKGNLKINEVEADDVIAWKNGQFVFEDEPLESVMKKIARWYDIEVEYRGADRSTRIGGGISRYENVSKVLKQLELTKGVHFKIEGRKIIAEK